MLAALVRRALGPRGASGDGREDGGPRLTELSHRVMFAFDICGFGRHPPHLHADLRGVLYGIVESSCAAHGVTWEGAYKEDRGDGMYFLAETPAITLVEDVALSIGTALRRHNRTVPGAAFRVRMAVHAGFVRHDGHGIVGSDIVLLFRLLDAPELRDALAGGHSGFAFAFSHEVFRRAADELALGRADYERVVMRTKEGGETAWIFRPGGPRPAGDRCRPSCGASAGDGDVEG
ncbi:hypothetical protein [Actinocorallia herbida]|nr:hypothetical protein [Actinocorallia herbida]